MRKIAVRAGMTATNIYNYFSNKDDIYLAIKTRGFSLLYRRFDEIDRSLEDPFIKMERMIRAYIDFGLNFPDQYEIMFSSNTPKYSDYLGTDLEPSAMVEKQTALQAAKISSRIILEINGKDPIFSLEDASYQTIRIWTAIHGIVSLMNSRVLQEVNQDTDRVIEKLIRDLIAPFYPPRSEFRLTDR